MSVSVVDIARTRKAALLLELRELDALLERAEQEAAPAEADPVLTLAEAERYLRISERTIYRRIEAGELTGMQDSPKAPWLFRRSELDRYLAERERKRGVRLSPRGKDAA